MESARPGLSADLAGPVARLVADGVSEQLAESFVAAAGAVLDPTTPDLARSAAERFLFERLESLPETAGRFALNARPGLRFGGRPMEVDLLAASLRIAVEIDGYHHFRDADAYRRDRRKDVELQRGGFRPARAGR
jgi:hypothetical protein